MRPPNKIRSLLPMHLTALLYAEDMVGVKEEYKNGKWSNWGPEVQQFLKAANISVPAFWCAAFVNWSAEQAGIDHEQPSNMLSALEAVPLQGYVQSYYEWAVQHDRLISPAEAGPGDLFVLYYSNLGRYGHIGFVVECNEKEGWYTTVEGNTNEEGSREGNTVAKKKRNITPGTKFIRWD